MAVIWGRGMYRSAYAPADRSEGCYRIVQAYDDRWYVTSLLNQTLAGPYSRASSARRKAMMLVARSSAASSGVHPRMRQMAHAEAAAIRQAAARPAWH